MSILGIVLFFMRFAQLSGSELKGSPRRLLQQGMKPIPDQVIDATQPYSYNVSGVFSGSVTAIGAVEVGQSWLPSWLTFQYNRVGSYGFGNGSGAVVLRPPYAFLAQYYGLRVLNISDVTNPILAASWNNDPYGAAFALVISGNTLYLANQNSSGGTDGLQILNIANPLNPVLLGTYSTKCTTLSGLAVSGNTLIISSVGCGLFVLNVANPNAPTLAAGCGGPSYGVRMKGTIAYVAMWNYGIWVVDVSNPPTPVFLNTSMNGLDVGYATSVDLQGNLLVTGNNAGVKSSISLWNIAGNPKYPVFLNLFRLAEGTNTVVLTNNLVLCCGRGGVEIVDVSNPLAPISLGRWLGTYGFSAAMMGNLVFSAGGSFPEFEILDVTQGQLFGTATKVLSGRQPSIQIRAYNASGSAVSTTQYLLTLDQLPRKIESSLLDKSILTNQTYVQVIDSSLLFADGDPQFLSITVSTNPSQKVVPSWMRLSLNPVFLSLLDFQSLPIWDIEVLGTRAYVTALQDGLFIADVSNSNLPKKIANFPTPGPAMGIYVQGTIVYLAVVNNSTALMILDTTDEKNLILLGTYPVYGGARDVVVQNNIAYLACGGGGFQILNVTFPSLITNLANFTNTFSHSVALRGTLALVSQSYFAPAQFIDVSIPTAPVLKKSFGNANRVRLAGSLAFYDYTPVSILNVSDVLNPVVLSNNMSIASPNFLSDISVHGNTLFAVADLSDFRVYDISNPSAPQMLASVIPPSLGRGRGVAIASNIAYIAHYGSFTSDPKGLTLMDISQWQLSIDSANARPDNYRIYVNATDPFGVTASTSFLLRVEGAPQINARIPLQYAPVGQSFNYFVPQGLITDPNKDTLAFAAKLANGPLPNWLSFNPISTAFAGVPQICDVGTLNITISATDNILGNVSTWFLLFVGPTVPSPPPRFQEHAFNFSIPAMTFAVTGVSFTQYDLLRYDGSAAPPWVNFSSSMLMISGVPPASTSSLNLKVVARSSQNDTLTAPISFTLLPNTAIQVTPIANQIATVSYPFLLFLPTNVFVNPNGFPLTYSASPQNGSSWPSWLRFNATEASFSGTPDHGDTNFKSARSVGILVRASDGFLNATMSFYINVIGESWGEYALLLHPVQPPPPVYVGRYYSFSVPTQIFTQPYLFPYANATQKDGSPLPNWWHFNSSNFEFFGTPPLSCLASYVLAVAINAWDANNNFLLVPLNFQIVTNQPLQVAPIPSHISTVGASDNIYLLATTFVNPNNNFPLNLSASQQDGSRLPDWLHFNSTLPGNFYGTPGHGDTNFKSARSIDVIVTATDGIVEVTMSFSILVVGMSWGEYALQQTATTIPIWPPPVLKGRHFTYKMSDQLFAGVYTFTYSNATGSDGSPLPSWFMFDSINHEFSGLPPLSYVGLQLEVLVSAWDANNVSLLVPLNFQVVANRPLQVAPVSGQIATVGISFGFSVASAFVNPNSNVTLNFNATLQNGSSLPDWLHFDPTGTFSGTPHRGDTNFRSARSVGVLVKATDGIVEASVLFSINVVGESWGDFALSQAVQPIVPKIASVGQQYSYLMPAQIFQVYSFPYSNATLSDGSPLPNWLSFDSSTHGFSGIVSVEYRVGFQLDVIVNAWDANGVFMSVPLSFTILPTLPIQVIPISSQTATVGAESVFSVASAFVNPNSDSPPTFKAHFSGGSKLTWLSFNSSTGVFSGTPGPEDTNFDTVRPIDVTVVASYDALNASTTFRLNVGGTSYGAAVLDDVNKNTPDKLRPPPVYVERLFNWSLPDQLFNGSHKFPFSNATKADGAPLDPWLNYNPIKRQFTGTPPAVILRYIGLSYYLFVTVNVWDANATSMAVPLSFQITANLPLQKSPIASREATVDKKFTFDIPALTFATLNGIPPFPLSYDATFTNGAPLSGWLTFKYPTFSGTPKNGDTDFITPRTLTILLSASDGVMNGTLEFTINVGGASYVDLILWYASGAVSILTTVVGVYKARAYCCNFVRRRKFMKQGYKEVVTNPDANEFMKAFHVGYHGPIVTFNNPPGHLDNNSIRNVEVKLDPSMTDAQGYADPLYDDVLGRRLKMPLTLPGGATMPSWLEFDPKTSTVATTKPIPSNEDGSKYYVWVSASGGVVIGQYGLHILAADAPEHQPLLQQPPPQNRPKQLNNTISHMGQDVELVVLPSNDTQL